MDRTFPWVKAIFLTRSTRRSASLGILLGRDSNVDETVLFPHPARRASLPDWRPVRGTWVPEDLELKRHRAMHTYLEWLACVSRFGPHVFPDSYAMRSKALVAKSSCDILVVDVTVKACRHCRWRTR